MYGYCGGGPVGAADPWGLKRIWWSLQKWLVTDDGYSDDEFFEAGLASIGQGRGFDTAGEAAKSAFSFGLYKPSDADRQKEGYETSRALFAGARDCLMAATGMKAAEVKVHQYATRRPPGSGFTSSIRKKGIVRFEVQEWRPGQPKWQRPHFHLPANGEEHLPWEWFPWWRHK